MCYRCCQGVQRVIAIELARYQCVVAVVMMINVLMLLNGYQCVIAVLLRGCR